MIFKVALRKKSQVIFLISPTQIIFWRADTCLDNLYHTFPSEMMKTDAMAQFLVQKNGTKTLMLTGSLNEDTHLSKSFIVSSKKFGVKKL